MYGPLNWILDNLGNAIVPVIVLISILIKNNNKSQVKSKKPNINLETMKRSAQAKASEIRESQAKGLKENKLSTKGAKPSKQEAFRQEIQKKPLEPEVSYYDRVYEEFTAKKVKKENRVYTEQGLENDKYDKLTRTQISNPETLAARRNTLKKAVIYSEILGRPRALNKFDFHKR